MLSDSPPVRIVMIGLSLPKRSAGNSSNGRTLGGPASRSAA